jgi:hypothetical protein
VAKFRRLVPTRLSYILGVGHQHQGVDLPPPQSINHHFTQLAFHDLRDGAMRYRWTDRFEYVSDRNLDSSDLLPWEIPQVIPGTRCNQKIEGDFPLDHVVIDRKNPNVSLEDYS